MRYLNEIITVPITADTVPAYSDYMISYADASWSPLSYNILYTGRVYCYKDGQEIYINDILASLANYDWMSYDSIRKHNLNRVDTTQVYTTVKSETSIFKSIKVQIDDQSTIFDVALMFRDKRNNITPSIKSLSELTNTTKKQTNLLTQQTNILPRIPCLKQTSTDFFVGCLFASNAGYSSNPRSQIVIVDGKSTIVSRPLYKPDSAFVFPSPISSIIFNGSMISGNGFDSETYRGNYLAIAPYNQSNYTPTLIAKYDDCNADYYLIWTDRSGAYQCQPFHKKSTMKETIGTPTITSLFDEKRPMNKTIHSVWELNSDWLTFEEHKAYESIYTSPYSYLYDVKYNELTPVICEETEWIEKTINNTKKPFNLKVTLKENRVQNIYY